MAIRPSRRDENQMKNDPNKHLLFWLLAWLGMNLMIVSLAYLSINDPPGTRQLVEMFGFKGLAEPFILGKEVTPAILIFIQILMIGLDWKQQFAERRARRNWLRRIAE